MRGELELTIKDPLDFDYHLNRYEQALANEETKAGGMICALTDYQMSVRSGLSKFTGQALATANRLKNKKAQQYLTYGVGRRLRMMLVSYCGIFDTIAPDRKEPLPLNDMAAVSRDLNIIYINIRGTLDNYAWCIYHERGMELKESQVGLFYKEFRNDANFKNLKALLDSYDDWNADLKSRRDPSAHRMPLYVPPAILKADDVARHQQIWKEREEAIRTGKFERDTELANEQSKLGTFRPNFLHDPDHGGVPIFPTVLTDVAKLIAIGTAIQGELLGPSTAA